MPSVALYQKRVNGKNILVGNNANEGPFFVPQNINTLGDLKAWIRLLYPTVSEADIEDILNAYPSTDAPVNPDDPKFATDGLGGASAVNVSQVATGQQQRANVWILRKHPDIAKYTDSIVEHLCGSHVRLPQLLDQRRLCIERPQFLALPI